MFCGINVWFLTSSMFGRNEASRIQRNGARMMNMISEMITNLSIEIPGKEVFMIYFERSLKVSLTTMNCLRFKKMKTRAKTTRSRRKMMAPAEALEML